MTKIIKDILYGVSIISVKGNMDTAVDAVVFDSRLAKPGAVFVAIEGTTVDAHNFIPKVIEQGCTTIIAQKAIEVAENVNLIVVNDTSKALGIMSAPFLMTTYRFNLTETPINCKNLTKFLSKFTTINSN